ncbi:class I SAM-dependent methyltransferase [Salinimicrobium flavum]|uniref:class I SAM-dependent methyltransferase n=1 Tax=Salinimicrobium flavum TaxID=1737065 RepID=UPI0036D3B8E7
MNPFLLNTEIQEFIERNYKEDISEILLKGSPFLNVSPQELAVQIIGKKKAEKKLPTWFNTKGIVYPPRINLEQTSSEITAEYKASLVSGNLLLDLTGGFGIDSFFFSGKVRKLIHTELNEELSALAAHNFEVLGAKNIETFTGDGLEYLRSTSETFDWVFIDPSRRDDSGGRVFHLSDCLPDVPENLELLWEKAENILVKTSPLLDLQAGIKALKTIKEIHVIAVENDVKELLWVLKKEAVDDVLIKTINFRRKEDQYFEGNYKNRSTSEYSAPLAYLYEPNAAIMKSGLFEAVGTKLGLGKLHMNSHLYTSEELVDFPGRTFKVNKVLPYKKKQLKKELAIEKAHITTRNFPETVSSLRKNLKIKDGGDNYLFFTTIESGEKVVIFCEKLED